MKTLLFSCLILLIVFPCNTYADNFLLDMEKEKNPRLFNENPAKLSKDELIYRVSADEKGIAEYTKKISTLKNDTKKLASKITSLSRENSKLKKDQQIYLEKIEKLSSRLEELDKVMSVDSADIPDISTAYKKLQQEYKQLELYSALKGGDGNRIYQLEKENAALRRDMDTLVRELNTKPMPRAFVGGTSVLQ